MAKKEAETHYEAIKRIVSDSGKHFDPTIVNAFLKVEKVFNSININHKELCS